MTEKESTKVEMEPLGKAYDPAKTEHRWYEFWANGGFFEPSWEHGDEPFVIVMPPPNVTGELHMGHALFVTAEDIMVRYHRMKGRPSLWLPGADHAGIAGQWVVERELANQDLTRHELGRERFIEEVWEWMDRYQIRIREQLTSLGASSDWSRYRFTMDPGPARAVRTVFKTLYDEGLIYRGERLISWCPRCNTALSDLEVVHVEVEGSLWHIRYPLTDKSGYIEVATTRPETMLGDTAVAVHPDDDRYQHLVGTTVMLPIANREIPIVADSAVDPEFGSGAVKVTPAHDPNDWDIGNRHNLPRVTVINFDGTMNEQAGEYSGQSVDQARVGIAQQLEDDGFLVRVENHPHSVGTCDRCESVVEPLISKQWFVSMKPLAEPAIQAAYNGDVRFVPERFTRVYLDWMENIHDWCISRQLWWGHRIPVWTCLDCGHQWASVEEHQDSCGVCASQNIEQDPDVLDTWFSSGLWPFSMLGWPEKTEDLARYYPGSVLETGYDIIFFWVARMIFFGLKFMGEVPFHTVYLHGTVRDANGQRMSKTKGNVLDPTTITAKYGTDALRFTLITASGPGADLKLAEEHVESNRNFANKLYNATRFVLGAIEGAQIQLGDDGGPAEPAEKSMSLADKWIVSRLDRTLESVNRNMENYQFHEAGRELYEFIWSEYCDWYIEAAKVRLRADTVDPAAAQTLAFVLERSLRLLHPFMPFVSEELWQRLPHTGPALIVAPWPESNNQYEGSYAAFEVVKEVVRSIRNARAEQRVEPARRIAAIVYPGEFQMAFDEASEEIKFLGRIASDGYDVRTGEPVAPDNSISIVAGPVSVFLPMSGMVDLEAERSRLSRELQETRDEADRAREMLGNEQFTSKAPAAVIEKQRLRLSSALDQIEMLESRLAAID